MVNIKQLEIKKDEFLQEYGSLERPSVHKTSLEKKARILVDLIKFYKKLAENPPSDLDLVKVEEILENQCYFEPVKKKVIEKLEIAGLRPFIWCLVGPSGTGKTTFVQLLTQALEKEFFSFALGGVSDPSILTGKEDEIGLLTNAL